MLSRLVVMLVMSASANGVMGTKLKSILGYRRRSSLFSLAVLFVRVWNRPIFFVEVVFVIEANEVEHTMPWFVRYYRTLWT